MNYLNKASINITERLDYLIGQAFRNNRTLEKFVDRPSLIESLKAIAKKYNIDLSKMDEMELIERIERIIAFRYFGKLCQNSID